MISVVKFTATGKLTFEAGAVISTESDSIIDFDLTQMEAGTTVLVNDLSVIQGSPRYTLTVDGLKASGVYSLAGGAAAFTGTISVVNKAGNELGTLTVGKTLKVGCNTCTLNLTDSRLSLTIAIPDLTTEKPVGTAKKVSWEENLADWYLVEYSTDGFGHVLSLKTDSAGQDLFELPAGTYQWRVKADVNSDWAIGEAITAEAVTDTAPKVVQSDEDGLQRPVLRLAGRHLGKHFLCTAPGVRER